MMILSGLGSVLGSCSRLRLHLNLRLDVQNPLTGVLLSFDRHEHDTESDRFPAVVETSCHKAANT